MKGSLLAPRRHASGPGWRASDALWSRTVDRAPGRVRRAGARRGPRGAGNARRRDGETIGTAGVVRLGAGPLLVLSITGGRPGATYECVLLGADGSRTSGGTWTLADPGYGRTPSGAWLVPVDRTGVVGVELVTPEGKVWASAPL